MALRTSNPALGEKTFSRYAYLTGVDPTTRMTINGTLNKCMILAIFALATATAGWLMTAANTALVVPLALGSSVVAIIFGFVTCFKPDAAPVTAPIYALLEGLMLGSISQYLNALYPGIAISAAAITLAALGLMLGLYRAGILRATPMFTKVIVIATGAIALVYVASFVMRLFGGHMPLLNDATPAGIGISVVICVVAALNFILDFNTIEQGAEQGAPKFMEWYAAFGLMVTIFWLYLEVLRLLAKMRR